MPRLYVAEKRRRLGNAATSGSGVLPTEPRTASASYKVFISTAMIVTFLSTVNSHRKVSHVMLTQGANGLLHISYAVFFNRLLACRTV